MRTTSKFLALALTATMQSAMAGVVLLDFNGFQASQQLTNQYEQVGVTASSGGMIVTSNKCQYGTGTAKALGDVAFEQAEFKSQEPQCLSSPGALAIVETSLTLSFSGGFDAVSFVFSSDVDGAGLSATVFNANGTPQTKTFTGLGSGGQTWLNWSGVESLNWAGSSVIFTTAASTSAHFLIDNISFTTPANVGQLPEPTSIALTLGALAALGWARKRALR